MVRTAAVVFSTLLLSANAFAQSSRPAKMLIFSNNGVTATDYPSMAQCEASRADLAKRIEAFNSANQSYKELPGGGAIISPPIIARSLCFLG